MALGWRFKAISEVFWWILGQFGAVGAVWQDSLRVIFFLGGGVGKTSWKGLLGIVWEGFVVIGGP